MADITLSQTETEVFGGSVLEAYQHRDYFGEDWTIFYGMRASEKVNVPVFAAAVAENLDDGGSHDGSAQIDGVEVPLDLPVKAFVDIKKSQVDTRPDLNLLTNTGRALGRAVGYGRTVRIANRMMFDADAAGNTVSGAYTAGTATGENIAQGMESIAAEMDDLGIDSADRYGLLKPTQFYSLRGVARVISRDFTQGQSNNQAVGGNLSMLEYLSFMIRNCGGLFGIDWTDASDHGAENLPVDFDALAIVGLFWHKESTAIRHQTGLEANVEWIHRDQVWMPIARLHMGVQTVKVAGVWLLVDTSP